MYGLQEEVSFSLKRKSSQGNFFDDELSELKVGYIAQTTLKDVLESGTVTDDEVKLMMTKDYSKQVFSINYPLLAKKRNQDRYYAKPLVINNERYFLCNDWFDSNKPYLLKWLEDKQLTV